MTTVRVFVTGLAIVLAVVLQGTLVARLPLPGGVPNLAVLLVAGIALAVGATAGLAVGFTAGTLADLLSDHPVGVLALCLALVGFAVGLLEYDPDRGLFWPIIVVAAAATATYLLYTVVLFLVGDRAGSVVADLPSAVIYDVILTPLVIPLVAAAARRLGAPGSVP